MQCQMPFATQKRRRGEARANKNEVPSQDSIASLESDGDRETDSSRYQKRRAFAQRDREIVRKSSRIQRSQEGKSTIEFGVWRVCRAKDKRNSQPHRQK